MSPYLTPILSIEDIIAHQTNTKAEKLVAKESIEKCNTFDSGRAQGAKIESLLETFAHYMSHKVGHDVGQEAV